jgi:hypothetical protein
LSQTLEIHCKDLQQPSSDKRFRQQLSIAERFPAGISISVELPEESLMRKQKDLLLATTLPSD